MTGGTKRSSEEHIALDEAPSRWRESPPEDDAITTYDEAHFALYLELLDAESAGLTIGQMAKEAFNLDPNSEPVLSTAVVTNHLRREHWLHKDGARNFLV